MQVVAQGWLVLQLTNDAFLLGVVTAAQFLPVLVFGLFGGLIADALPKRRTLIATQAASLLLALLLGLLTATGLVQVWQIVVLALLLGTVNAVDMPTRQAFVIEMVGRADVVNAVGLNSAAFNAARIVGPAIGGLVIGAVGIAACFFINAASFVAVIASLLLMREGELRPFVAQRVERTVGAMVENLAEGLRYVRRTRVVLLAVVVVGLVSMFGMNFTVIMPVLARDVLGTGASGLGFLMAATGVGSVASALSIAYLGRPSPRFILAGAAIAGILEIAVAFVRSFPLALVCAAGIGAGAIGMAATANTTIQLAVPDGSRPRHERLHHRLHRDRAVRRVVDRRGDLPVRGAGCVRLRRERVAGGGRGRVLRLAPLAPDRPRAADQLDAGPDGSVGEQGAFLAPRHDPRWEAGSPAR